MNGGLGDLIESPIFMLKYFLNSRKFLCCQNIFAMCCDFIFYSKFNLHNNLVKVFTKLYSHKSFTFKKRARKRSLEIAHPHS